MNTFDVLQHYGPPSVVSTVLAVFIYFILERMKLKFGKTKTERAQLSEDEEKIRRFTLDRLNKVESRLDDCEKRHVECEHARLKDAERFDCELEEVKIEARDCHERCARLINYFTKFMDAVTEHGIDLMLETGEVAKMPNTAKELLDATQMPYKERRFIKVPVTVDRRKKKDQL